MQVPSVTPIFNTRNVEYLRNTFVKGHMKLTTDALRVTVAQAATTQVATIKREFTSEDDGPWDLLGDPKCWKRISKSRLGDGTVERIFDHREFDDQLRAYVISDASDVTVQKIWFAGE